MALKQPANVFYFTAVMYDPQEVSEPDNIVSSVFPSLGLHSGIFPFDHTEYYTPEMGSGLLKYFVAFSTPDHPGRLPEYKLAALGAEKKHFKNKGRTINIDPGYLATEKIVVASTKNFTHRIYLAEGIFGDLQLMRQKGNYSPMPWTYADYIRPEALTFFSKLYTLLHEPNTHIPSLN